MVCGIEGLDKFCERWEVSRRTDDFHELCQDPEVDLVTVCTPTFIHRPVVEAAAAAGKEIICEKPMATTLEDARAMVQLAGEAGVRLMYAEDWCFAPILKRVEEIVAEGALGKILYVKAKETHSGSHSEYAKKIKYCGGGALFHIGCHPINWVRHLIGSEVVEVVGKTSGGGNATWCTRITRERTGAWPCSLSAGASRDWCEGNYITLGGMDDTVEIYGYQGSAQSGPDPGQPDPCLQPRGLLLFGGESRQSTGLDPAGCG